MSDSAPSELRIYCICGQKMKVSEAMFGLPGKCIACRQKIRIPTPPELPSGTTEVHLKDYPEFLRKVKRPRTQRGERPDEHAVARSSVRAEDRDDIALGDTPGGAAALDILEPLRMLCSLEHKIQRQLDAMSDDDSLGDANDRQALLGYMDRIRVARSDFDDTLRQRMMEIAIELSSIEEKVVQAALSLRIGEIEFDAFSETADALRRRRDYLVRQQHNLRGWLLVSDPHTAGGYVNASLDDIPEKGFELILPGQRDDGGSLLDEHLDGLREALERRARADRRLREIVMLARQGNMSPTVMADCRADCDAEKGRAEAQVTFCRKRLEQLADDLAHDVQAIQAHLEFLTGQVKEGAVEQARFAALESKLLETQHEYAKMHDTVSQALVASTAQDVPRTRSSSLFKRMARSSEPGESTFGIDSAITWGAALVLGLSTFLPVFRGLSPVEVFWNAVPAGPATRWLMFGPVIVGVIATVIGALSRAEIRGVCIGILWFVFTVGGGVLAHETHYGQGSVAVLFRQGGSWLFRPGVIMMVLADLGLLIAACVALAPSRKLRPFLYAIGGGAVVVLLAVFTDFAGYYRPAPAIHTDSTKRTGVERPMYATSVAVANKGHRTLLIAPVKRRSWNAFTYALERKMEGGIWEEVNAPVKVEIPGETSTASMYDVRNILIPPGVTAHFHYTLEPGDYRVSMESMAAHADPVVEAFSLAEAPYRAAPEETPQYAAPEETGPGDRRRRSEGEPEAEPAAPIPFTAELRGVIAAEGRDPRFSIILTVPGRPERKLDLMLGDELFGDWFVNEYNPLRQSVTLEKGERVVVLNRGQPLNLE